MSVSQLRSVFDQIPNNLEGTGLSRCLDIAELPSVGFFLDRDPREEMPCFTKSKPWELWPAADNLGFEIDENGSLKIYEDASEKGVPTYAQIQIESFIELQEASEAFLNPQAPPASGAAFGSVRMSALVENIYFSVLTRQQLRLATWATMAKLFHGDLREWTASALIGQTVSRDGVYDDRWDYACLSIDPDDSSLIPPSQSDVLILGKRLICAATAYDTPRARSEFGVVLRLTTNASILFVLDVLRHSLEGAKAREELAAAKTWRDWLKTKEISAPGNRLLQIHQSIAFRQARQSYLSEVANLSYGREPLQIAVDLFARRKEMVRSLHDEMLLQVESLLQPLPFFIEYPYAQFIGTADRAQRVRNAQFALNILCKVLILLPLEELQRESVLPESAQKFVIELRKQPATDGKWLDVGRDFRKTIIAESLLPRFGIFSALIGDIGNRLEEQLRRLVTARNRLHHPPFDEKAFLETAAATLPNIIGQLREILCKVDVIIPKQIRPSRENTTVSAVKIMGENPVFRSLEFKTSLPAGEFIVDELAAYRAIAPEALIPLNHWFQTKTFSAESIDVGLFDRMEHDEPRYSFIAH